MDTQQHIPPIMHRTFSFFLFPFFLLLLLLPSCGRQGGTAQAPAPAGDTVPLRYATGFDIVRHGHYRELLVYNPWQPGAVLARYYLAGDDTTTVPPDGTRLRTPLRHVALPSVTHVEFMRLAGVLDRVDGLCSPRLACNATLFLLCGLLFDVSTMIYSILNTIFQAIAIDRAHQQSVNVQMLIFTKAESPELDHFILDNLHRGITRWEGKGVYTGEDTHILCVCLNKYQIEDLQQALLKADPKAFFIIQEGVHVSNNFERRLN